MLIRRNTSNKVLCQYTLSAGSHYVVCLKEFRFSSEFHFFYSNLWSVRSMQILYKCNQGKIWLNPSELCLFISTQIKGTGSDQVKRDSIGFEFDFRLSDWHLIRFNAQQYGAVNIELEFFNRKSILHIFHTPSYFVLAITLLFLLAE